MKYYGKGSMSSVLKKTLDVILIVGVIATILIFKSVLLGKVSEEISMSKKVLITVLLAVGICCVFLIVFNLIKVLNSLVNSNPFVVSNVIILKRVSIQCFAIAFCYIINFIFNSNLKEFQFIYVDNKGVHTDMEFIIFIFAGCFIYILSKVFQQAIDYKDENDFTV
ncbi:DUF2975 domain-containing protein [Clostridium algidicarnis]|uniref:DUF2975 domain-containing protein n=1 Tax=Clostridium algidicarnis TaxID=37659 RepID=UPI001C0E411E|nr:DUF2975 domain-containing protein [Clostridium algidicarnis]MBU3197369.1 DUF2975 domain-containing protein [Clostridium algidicarnis]